MNGIWCLDHTKPTTTNEVGEENNLLIVTQGGSISLEIEDLRPGANDFDFSINDTKFYDPALPTVMNEKLLCNTFLLYTDPRCPFVSLSSNLQMELHWKVQLIGNWSEELGNTIDCKFDEIGNLIAQLPELAAGEYEYKLLINGTQFVDESLTYKKDFFRSCNVFEISDDGESQF